MLNAAQIRWTILICALAATVAAIVAPAGESLADADAPPARTRTMARADAKAPAITMLQPFESEAETDPFALRGWTPPPVEEQKVAAPIQAPAAPASVVEQAPVAPPLPFRYMGRFSDDSGGYVYLAQGEQTHAVRVGDVILGMHKVISVSSNKIRFEYLPTGSQQELQLPDPEQ